MSEETRSPPGSVGRSDSADVGHGPPAETLLGDGDPPDPERAYVLLDDGAVAWASEPVESVLPGEDPPPEGEQERESFRDRFEEALDRAGARQYATAGDGDQVTEYAAVPSNAGWRYYRRERHAVDDAGATHLEVVADVTDSIECERRLGALEALADGTEDGLCAVDGAGRIELCTGAFAERLGYEPEELAGRELGGLLVDTDSSERTGLRANSASDGDARTASVRHRDGSETDLTVRPMAPEGDEYGWTVLRIAGRSEETTRSTALHVLEATDSALFEFDLATRDLARFGPLEGLYGVSFERIDSLADFYRTAVHPADRSKLKLRMEELAASSGPDRAELEFRTNPENGPVKRLRTSVRTRTNPDGSRELVGITTHVTERERQRRELRRYERIVETIDDVAFVVGGDDTVEDVNRAGIEVVGPQSDGIVGRSVLALVEEYGTEDDAQERFRTALDEARSTDGQGGPERLELALELPGGTRTFQYQFSPLSGGADQAVVVVARDVTDRHEREQRLRQYQRIIENHGDISYVIDTEKRQVYVDDRALELFDLEREDVIDTPVMDIVREVAVDSDAAQRYEAAVETALEGTSEVRVEFETDVEPFGIQIAEHRLSPYRVDGEIAGVVGIARDITDRKERQRELQRYERIVETIDDAAFVVGGDDTVEYANQAAGDNVDVPPAEAVGQSILLLVRDYGVEDDAEERFRTALDEARSTDGQGGPERLELALELPGGRRTFQYQFSPLAGGAGSVVVVARDVTGRIERRRQIEERNERLEREVKRREEAETRYQSLFENNPTVVWEEDLSAAKAYADQLAAEHEDREALVAFLEENPGELENLRDRIEVIDVNQRAVEYYGAASKAELVDSLGGLFGESSHEAGAEMWASIAAGETSFRGETASRTLDGQHRNQILELAVPDAYADDYSRAYVTVTDITDRKERQRELRRYERVVENLTEGVIRTTLDGEFVKANRAMVSLSGAESKAQLRELGIEPLYEDPADRERLLERLQQKGRIENEVVRADPIDGREMLVETSLTLVEENGEQFVDGIVRDVTGREERRRRLERTETLFEHAQDGLFLIDVDDDEFDLERVNPAYEEVTGLSAGQLRDRPLGEFLDERSRAEVAARRRECCNRQEPIRYETDLTMDGESRRQETRLAPVVVDGEVEAIAGSTRDVTERYERERTLRRYERLVNAAEDPMFAIDEDCRFNLVNDRFLELVGLDRTEAIGATPRQLFDSGVVTEAVLSKWESEYARLRGGDSRTTTFEFEIDPAVESGPRTFEADITLTEDAEPGSVATLRDVTIRRWRERQLQAERDRLARLEKVVTSVRPLTDELTGATERERMQESVCAGLVDDGMYASAWIGTYSRTRDRLRVRASAGLPDEHPDEIRDADCSDSPYTRALRTGEPQIAHETDPGVLPGLPADTGPRSVAILPLVHRSTTHGILAVHSTDDDAFEDLEISILGGLGRRLGHAISALENRRLLASDRTVELEFSRTPPASVPFAIADRCDCTVEVINHTRKDEDTSLWHLSVEDAEPGSVAAALAERPQVSEARPLNAESGGDVVQWSSTAENPIATLLDRGARIRTARATPAATTISAEVASGTGSRAIVEHVEAEFPGFKLAAQREREPADERFPVSRSADLWAKLTERQREVVEAAYYTGYYDWPRGTNAEELATALGVSSPTLHQHLRKAHCRVIGALVDDNVVSQPGLDV
ncbi:MAG: PAS domain S-box protein [Salinirussus sp.]